jgi:L-alanine-DL-glutamate epimerase-like enolase superfamily enzyme
LKITGVRSTLLRLPDVQPIGDGLQDVLVVEVDTDEGLVGIGEAHTMPSALAAIIDAPMSQLAVRGLRDLVLGEDPLRINHLWDRMWTYAAGVLGRRGLVMHAISAIDICLWDLAGKALGVPVHQLLGGAIHDRIRVYASDLMPDDEQAMIDRARSHVDAGFTAVKFGWGSIGSDVRQSVARVERLRMELGSDVGLMIDVGMPLPFDRAAALADGLADLDVVFLEEPLAADDHEGYRRLVERSRIRIAAGERETALRGFRDLVELAQLPIIQPDVARVGGITEARRIATLASMHGTELIPHCWSTDILVAASLHLLATLPAVTYLEVNASDNPFRTRLTQPHLRQHDGWIAVPQGPGLGVELDAATVERYRVA